MSDYLDRLLAEGVEVLQSQRSSGHPWIHNPVNSMKYHKWVLNCISFLGQNARDHVEKIKAVHKPDVALYHQAEQIFAILQSAVEFVRSLQPSLTRESAKETAPDSFSLDFLHPKVVEKCADHFLTAKYDDCILNAAKLVEVTAREVANLDDTHYGVSLMRKVFKPDSPIVKYSDNPAEQEAVMHLYAGFIGVFKNPHSHKFLEIKDPLTAFEILSFANHLYNVLIKVKSPSRPDASAP